MKVLSYMVEAHIFRENRNELEFLLLKRSEKEIYPCVWQMVTGSIKPGEKAYATALREIKEEADLNPVKMWVVPYVNSFYSRRRDHICLVPVFAAQVDSNAIVKVSHEHSEYKWVRLDEALKLLAWQGQRNSVKTIFDYFTSEMSYLNFEEIDLKRVRFREERGGIGGKAGQ